MLYSELAILNLTEERIKSIENDKGFIINVSYDCKPNHIISSDNKNGVCSSNFGDILNADNFGIQPYHCKCGNRAGKINNMTKCPICNTLVTYVGEDFQYFGWIVLNNDLYINPQMYSILKSFIGGPTLDDIIEPHVDGIDIDGKKSNKNIKRKPKSKYSGLGIPLFIEKFDEIMAFFLRSKKHKADIYDFIMENKDKVFTDSYPVYTIQLRPLIIESGECEYNIMNEKFVNLSKVAGHLNEETSTLNSQYGKDKTLFKFQSIVNDIYTYILKNILPNKFGSIKKVIGGRCNLTSRNVIIPNPNLHIDECIISYYSAVKVLEQFIINFLYHNIYHNMNEARIRWQNACSHKDELVELFIIDLIKNHKSGRGFPIITNRNPTISFGGIMAMYVVGINDSYSLEISLLLCKTMGADFDGDKFNSLWCIYDEFIDASQEIINPRNNMLISKNDGKFNKDMSPTDDIIMNLNTIHDMYGDYSDDEINHNMSVKSKKRY